MTSTLPFATALGAAGWLTAAIVVVGARVPAFSHTRMAISELGTRGSRFERLVSYAVFLPVGALAIGAALLLLRQGPYDPARIGTAALAACLGIAYIGAAIAPCKPHGAPLDAREVVHWTAAAVEYVGGPYALALAALGAVSGWLVVAATVALLAALACTVGTFVRWRGALQRVADGVLWGALVVLAYQLG